MAAQSVPASQYLFTDCLNAITLVNGLDLSADSEILAILRRDFVPSLFAPSAAQALFPTACQKTTVSLVLYSSRIVQSKSSTSYSPRFRCRCVQRRRWCLKIEFSCFVYGWSCDTGNGFTGAYTERIAHAISNTGITTTIKCFSYNILAATNVVAATFVAAKMF